MEILITHLTRMDGDRVCVAGLTENGMSEDWLIDADASYAVRAAGDAEIHEWLDAVAVDSLAKAFTGLDKHGHNRWTARPGRIVQSLAVVRAHAWRLVPQPQWERAILGYRDAELPAVTLPIADLRLFPDGYELDFEVLQRMLAFLQTRSPVLVCVGLSRPWAKDDGPELHWTQANTLWPDRADRVRFLG